jgi:hypothetical protein
MGELKEFQRRIKRDYRPALDLCDTGSRNEKSMQTQILVQPPGKVRNAETGFTDMAESPPSPRLAQYFFQGSAKNQINVRFVGVVPI